MIGSKMRGLEIKKLKNDIMKDLNLLLLRQITNLNGTV